LTHSYAAIVVTHFGGPLLEECLASLRAQTLPFAEILVVVSRDSALPVSAPALQLGENVGYARAANIGIAATEGHPLLLNDDTRLDPDCLAALNAAFTGNGVFLPRIELVGGGMDNVGHGLFPDGAVWARGRGAPAGPVPGVPGGFSGAAVLFARETWSALGGFDGRFGSFGEDVDLSLRLLRRGVPLTVVEDAVVHHHLGASFGRTSPEKLRAIERNRVRAAVRSLPLTALLTLPAWTFGRYALFFALASAGRGPGGDVPSESRRAALRGALEGLRDAPAWWIERRRDRDAWALGELEMWHALWVRRARWEDVARENAAPAPSRPVTNP
jgi:GT2 family glycosyltransferase